MIKFDTGKNSREYKITSANCSRIFRRHAEADGSLMLVGDYFHNQTSVYGADTLVADNPDKYQLLEKFSDIYVEIEDRLKSGGFFGIRDDYQFYDANRRNIAAFRFGKVMIIDKEDYNVHHIFFDDEVSNGDECCVDLWDIVEKKRVSISDAYDKFLVEVDTIEAILNPDYFINAFNKSVKKREDDLVALDTGFDEATISYEYLKTCKPSEYLEKTVFPLLLPAFQIVEEQRPCDPLNFIAVYLMENKDKVFIPQKEVQKEVQAAE